MTTTIEPGPEAPSAPIRAPQAESATASTPTSGIDADPSLAHLFGRLAIVESRIADLVGAQRANDPNPADPFRGLYISDAQARALLDDQDPEGAPAAAAEGGSAHRASMEDRSAQRPIRFDHAGVELAADVAEAAGAVIRLRRLARAFDLESVDVDLLLVAAAPDLDSRYERLYGYLNDDVSRRRASVGLALRICGLSHAEGRARARFAAQAPLVEGGLLVVEVDRPFLGRALTVPDRVTAHLLGEDAPDPLLLSVATLEAAPPGGTPGTPAPQGGGTRESPAEAEAALVRGLRGGLRLAYLRERTGSDGAVIARRAMAGVGLGAIVLDLGRVTPSDEVTRIVAAAVREARLHGAGIIAGPVEALVDRGAWGVRLLAEAPCPVVLLGQRSWDPAWSHALPLLLEAPLATGAAREHAWRTALADMPGAQAAIAEIAEYPFRLGAQPVARAASSARWTATAEGRPVTSRDLAAGVRAQNAAGLERLARRITPHAGWSDLVMPRDIVGQLRDLGARARHRDAVLDGWRLADPSRGRGLTALFTGDSGTGKTLSAEVVAGELGLDLYVIDLSTVVDKYVGETEKNLDRVFGEADGVNGILLFDEADAIFGKRSEVHDARDRYANVEIAYLLQRMERFDGMAILTTNLRANLDEAFTRRLDVLIDFPMPDEVQRRRLWDRHLVPSLPLAGEIDVDFLARRFRVSGGSVRNIVLAAAYLAAAEGRSVTMTDLIRGTGSEYRKLGHLSTEAEFGPYFGLLAS